METTIRNTSLGVLHEKLQEQQRAKRDLIVPAHTIAMNEGKLIIDRLPENMFEEQSVYELIKELEIEGSGMHFDVNDNAANQIAHKLKIPRSFYQYLQAEHMDILDHNVSELFDRASKNYFIRAFAQDNPDKAPGIVRAVLSDQFKVIDHLDVLGSTLEAIRETGAEVQVGRCNLTEDNMYVEIISKDVVEHADDLLGRYRSPKGNDRDGDNRVFAGFVISNSETGRGRYKVQPRAMVAKCSNGMIFKADALAATHLGSKMSGGVIWQQDTLATEVELITKQTRDAVNQFLSPEYLGRKIAAMTDSIERLERPVKAVENVCKTLSIGTDRVEDVVSYFTEGGDNTNMGVVNALTYYAQQTDDADLQYEIEEEAPELLAKIPAMQAD